MYPNPSAGPVTIESSFPAPLDVEVFDLLGRKVTAFRAEPETRTQLSLAGVAPGLYLVRAAGQSWPLMRRAR